MQVALKKFSFFALGLAIVAIIAAWRVSKSWSYTLIGSLVSRVETDQPLIALTFDDGPTPEGTERVLDILAARDAKATFFVIGQELEQNMLQGKKIVEAGHELGNHSYSHKRMVLKSPAFIREEIRRTDELIRQAGYRGSIHFRPPYAAKLLILPFILREQKRLSIFMDLAPDSLPEIEHDRARITDYVVEHARPGSIVLMHVMYGSRGESVAALPEILRRLGSKGFEFVTVSKLLAAGTPSQGKVHLAGRRP